jgi:hypothetical protein
MNPDLYRLMEHTVTTKKEDAPTTGAESLTEMIGNRKIGSGNTHQDADSHDHPRKVSESFHYSTNKDEIYEYYKSNLIPALSSSLPLLLVKVKEDFGSIVFKALMKVVHLLIPFTRQDFEWHGPQMPHVATEAYGNLTQFLLNQFDSDHDGE